MIVNLDDVAHADICRAFRRMYNASIIIAACHQHHDVVAYQPLSNAGMFFYIDIASSSGEAPTPATPIKPSGM